MTAIKGADFKIQIYYDNVWNEITCETTSADWTWGASEVLGPLTEAEAGTLRVSLYDPNRKYDPDNPNSPLITKLKVGTPIQVLVDNAPAFVGVFQTWGWDRATEIADLNCFDALGMLSMRILPENSQFDPPPSPAMQTTAEQVQTLLNVAEWPVNQRYFPSGNAGIFRGNHYYGGTAIEVLWLVRSCELGRVYATKDGRIGWEPRGGSTAPPITATINCGGAGLTDMWTSRGMGRVRNHVILSDNVIATTGAPPIERRIYKDDATRLQLGMGQDAWANYIITELANPKPLTVLGTILPTGSQIKPIVCAEYGARWSVVTDTETKTVEVVGARVTLAPDVLEVDAITQDISTAPGGGTITKYRDAIMATSGLVGYWRVGESSTAQAAADERGVHPGAYQAGLMERTDEITPYAVSLGNAGAVSDSNTSGYWGMGSWINVPHATTLNLADAWSIEAWISPATLTSSDWRAIASKGTGAYYLRLNQNGYLELVKSDVAVLATSTVTIPAGVWAYVVGTKSGATCKLYVNAVDRTGTVTNQATVNGTHPFKIGADPVGGSQREGFVGGMDEIAIYSRALTLSEIQAHYAARV